MLLLLKVKTSRVNNRYISKKTVLRLKKMLNIYIKKIDIKLHMELCKITFDELKMLICELSRYKHKGKDNLSRR